MKGIPDMRTALLVGGIPLATQLYRLQSTNIKLIVATPARLVDILSNHSGSLDVSSIQIVVLDEVDSLLLMGFDKQVNQQYSVVPTLI
jgi:ATP-dependent RNA helicase DDX59